MEQIYKIPVISWLIFSAIIMTSVVTVEYFEHTERVLIIQKETK